MKWIILVVFVTPIVVCWGLTGKPATNDGWLSFWGGYLGAIISIFGAFWLFKKQSIKDKQEINDTLKAQMKITSTFAYYEYLLAENKELLSIIQKTSDDLYDFYKVTLGIVAIPTNEEKMKMNPLNKKLMEDFNGLLAITAVLYEGEINDLCAKACDEYFDWHYFMVNEHQFQATKMDFRKMEIQKILDGCRTEITRESSKLIVRMREHMDTGEL